VDVVQNTNRIVNAKQLANVIVEAIVPVLIADVDYHVFGIVSIM